MTIEKALDKAKKCCPEHQELVYNGQEILDLKNILEEYIKMKQTISVLLEEIKYLKNSIKLYNKF